ncbi:ATP-binding cassette domain-containing protein [Micromonospora parathelypteridis]|uniref:ABC-2 type transport system ATP-binding protein n=1 Tax=Micromonospora parathelypteridis TaxID=1839617 RepID=A0A840VH22_9ACTN|nr:ATP-binding cassette domain-containing protein [Micromonospora parathelypteridis]MBB5476113.1 ABC-2 type transport system ATP-binding protein [Micromonospora parathelypteridis]GGO32758.1 ABC transporter [Micromonospora parathelypteridis]
MIKVRGLAKTFKARRTAVPAVRGVDIDVAEGEMVGFLGPNGAGKSTTLRMLATLLRPTAGEAVIAGCDLLSDPGGVRLRIGYVGQGNGAGTGQRVREELVIQARLYGLRPAAALLRVDELLARYELEALADRLVGTLSGGQRRRLDIVMGVLHRPGLVFLDEPSTALDPQSRNNLWQHIRSLRDEHGCTIFLTTHYLDEVDALCERILIIDDGRIISEGTPDGLKAGISGDLVTLATIDPPAAAAAAARIPDVQDVTVDGPHLRFRVPGGDAVVPELMRVLESYGNNVLSVQIQRPTLDDVFLTLTGRSLREADAAPVPS